MHSWTQVTQENRQVRQAPLQKAQPYRKNVRQAQRLEARRNSLRKITNRLPLRHRTRSYRHILVMNPDPK